jgi:GH25 family lysozyme M1 (1,4-beta-N-acetylmuramidase)
VIGGALRWVAEAARRAVAEAYAAPHADPAPTPASAPYNDHTPPFLVVDLYWKDLDGRPDWRKLLEAQWVDQAGVRRDYNGAILKATEGTRYYRGAVDWFKRGWSEVREAADASDSYGVDFVRGAYHFLRYGVSGARQAAYYLETIEDAGGWGRGDALPILDVEDSKANLDALALAVATYRAAHPKDKIGTRALEGRIIADTARDFVAAVKRETGRNVILYGGSALGARGVRDRLGCSWLWPAAYTARMSSREATSIGWTVPEIAMWQYTDGKICKAVTTKGTRLPRVVPGFGAVDCSVFTGGSTIADFMHVLCGDGPTVTP